MHREIIQVIKFGKKQQNINNLQCDVNLSTFARTHTVNSVYNDDGDGNGMRLHVNFSFRMCIATTSSP